MLNSLEVLIVTENSNVELQALVLVNFQRNTKTTSEQYSNSTFKEKH